MLLRASSESSGEIADIETAMTDGDGGVEHGELLGSYAEALTKAAPELDELRARVLDVLGPERFVEAAATIGIFNGLVRVADSTGISLDSKTVERSATYRSNLGLNDFVGATSSGVTEGRETEEAAS